MGLGGFALCSAPSSSKKSDSDKLVRVFFALGSSMNENVWKILRSASFNGVVSCIAWCVYVKFG